MDDRFYDVKEMQRYVRFSLTAHIYPHSKVIYNTL